MFRRRLETEPCKAASSSQAPELRRGHPPDADRDCQRESLDIPGLCGDGSCEALGSCQDEPLEAFASYRWEPGEAAASCLDDSIDAASFETGSFDFGAAAREAASSSHAPAIQAALGAATAAFEAGSFGFDVGACEGASGAQASAIEGATTVMIRNLPLSFTRPQMEALLDAEGFKERYDFIYLPAKLSTGVCFGYAFINLVSQEDATSFMDHFHGFDRWLVPMSGQAATHISQELQGLEANIARYRNSALMHPTVPDWLRPALYQQGERVVFPEPTVQLRPPRMRGNLTAANKERKWKPAKHSGRRR